jgi:predicted ribosomally synthesized peptide with nif11-like leader
MSEQTALDFIKQVRCSPVLSRRINALKGAGAVRDLVQIAAEEGFRFTEDEYRQAIVTLSNGELSEDSLNALSREMGLNTKPIL